MLTQSTPRIWYELSGSGPSHVLLIMGLGMRGELWRFQLEHLNKVFTCCTFDHVGSGASEDAEAWPTTHSLAAHVVRLVDELGWQKFHVVGVSLGGCVAQELSITMPGRILSLTLISSHCGGGLRWTAPSLGALMTFFAANLFGQRARVMALRRNLYSPGFLSRHDPVELDAALAQFAGKPASRRPLRDQLSVSLRNDLYRRVHQIVTPTLVIRPDQDRLIPSKNSDRLVSMILGAELVSFPDAGHGILHEESERLGELLVQHARNSEQVLRT